MARERNICFADYDLEIFVIAPDKYSRHDVYHW